MRLAVLVHAFPMQIIYHCRRKNAVAPEYCEYFEDVEDMLRQADALSIHVPLTSETVGLIGEHWIRLLKPGIHCPGAGPGQGRLIFAGPDPGPQGRGRVRAGSGPTLGPAIFRQLEKHII